MKQRGKKRDFLLNFGQVSHFLAQLWSNWSGWMKPEEKEELEKELQAAAPYGVPNFWESQSSLEKAMAPHSSTLAWKIPWMEEPGRLQFMGLLRVRHNWATSLSLFTFMHWRRKWQPTPVFLPGESQGRGNLMGCRLWSRTELDTTEAT